MLSLFNRKNSSAPSPPSAPSAPALELDDLGTALPVTPGNPLRPVLIDEAPPASPRLAAEPLFRVEHPLCDADARVEWIAERLILAGDPFAHTVHVPASTRGGTAAAAPKGAGDAKIITYATFRGVIGRMLAESGEVQERCLPSDLITQATFDAAHPHARDKVERGGELLTVLFLHYWRAVAGAYADAWADPRAHLLWQPAGLSAFASLGALVIRDHVDAYNLRQHYFDDTLTRVAAIVPVDREAYSGVAAHDVTEHLIGRFVEARAAIARTRGRTAIPGTIGGIDWGSGSAPRSPDIDG